MSMIGSTCDIYYQNIEQWLLLLVLLGNSKYHKELKVFVIVIAYYVFLAGIILYLCPWLTITDKYCLPFYNFEFQLQQCNIYYCYICPTITLATCRSTNWIFPTTIYFHCTFCWSLNYGHSNLKLSLFTSHHQHIYIFPD